jgi:hypothetical protein
LICFFPRSTVFFGQGELERDLAHEFQEFPVLLLKPGELLGRSNRPWRAFRECRVFHATQFCGVTQCFRVNYEGLTNPVVTRAAEN